MKHVRTRIKRWGTLGARLVALGATAWLLIATPAPDTPCPHAGTTVFLVGPGCGPGGLVVLDASYRLHNPGALGIAPDPGVATAQVTPELVCAPTAQGRWSIDRGIPDGGVVQRTCRLVVSSDAGVEPAAVVCHVGKNEICRASWSLPTGGDGGAP